MTSIEKLANSFRYWDAEWKQYEEGKLALKPQSFNEFVAPFIEMHKQEMEKVVDEAITNYEIGWSDRKVQIPQQEISDEEIEKGAWEYVKKHKINGGNVVHWKNAIKWYREQLKK